MLAKSKVCNTCRQTRYLGKFVKALGIKERDNKIPTSSGFRHLT